MHRVSQLRIQARRSAFFLLLAACLCPSAVAEQVQVTLDPAATKISISVHDVHGGVHGTFKLKSGSVVFDRETGDASGEIIVDARSGETGNSSRDRKMHKDVLESARYPEITFTPKRLIGNVAAQGQSNIQVQGVFHIHSADHDLTMSMPVQVSGDQVTATTTFIVPYQAWGMKNPSMLFLRVDGNAEVSVSAVGRITAMKAANSR
jgi:polyisoprenoid-binding protein YceI